MLGNFFKYLFLSKFSKNSLFPPIFLLIYNLNINKFGSHKMWGFIWIQIVCKGHQWSSKFTASRLRVKNLQWSLTEMGLIETTTTISFQQKPLISQSLSEIKNKMRVTVRDTYPQRDIMSKCHTLSYNGDFYKILGFK